MATSRDYAPAEPLSSVDGVATTLHVTFLDDAGLEVDQAVATHISSEWRTAEGLTVGTSVAPIDALAQYDSG